MKFSGSLRGPGLASGLLRLGSQSYTTEVSAGSATPLENPLDATSLNLMGRFFCHALITPLYCLNRKRKAGTRAVWVSFILSARAGNCSVLSCRLYSDRASLMHAPP